MNLHGILNLVWQSQFKTRAFRSTGMLLRHNTRIRLQQGRILNIDKKYDSFTIVYSVGARVENIHASQVPPCCCGSYVSTMTWHDSLKCRDQQMKRGLECTGSQVATARAGIGRAKDRGYAKEGSDEPKTKEIQGNIRKGSE